MNSALSSMGKTLVLPLHSWLLRSKLLSLCVLISLLVKMRVVIASASPTCEGEMRHNGEELQVADRQTLVLLHVPPALPHGHGHLAAGLAKAKQGQYYLLDGLL